MSRLEELVSTARRAVARRRERVPADQLAARLGERDEVRPFKEALGQPGISLIAEFKRRSPSAGDILPDADPAAVASAYELGGATALSILTEDAAFGGSLDDLRAARRASTLPILRKDFVVDPYQLHEAVVYGADAILLIAAALDAEALWRLHGEARALDLDLIVEVHDERDLERAVELDADVIGINNRDLRDFNVDLETTAELVVDVPAGKTVVAESGYTTREQIEELDRIGVDAVLIGEALMRSPDPELAVRELVGGENGTREHPVLD